MDYQIRNANGTTEAKLTGRLTFEDMKIFREMIEEIRKSDPNSWVLDLTELEFIDSAGLGLLLRVKATSEQESASLSLRVPNSGKVKEMMDVSQFEQLIPFC